jgi:hypothetical protein
MRLDLGVYSALLACGLGAAYWASLPAKAGDEEKISVYQISPKQVAELHYKSKEVDATAARRPEDGRFWVHHVKTEEFKTPPKDPHNPKAPEPVTPPPKVTTETFLANEKMDELLKSFDPFQASRVIGKVDDKQLDDFGLKDKGEVWTIKDEGGKVWTLYLGKRSYGSRSRFAMEEGGRVILVDDTGFENLERAPLRMYDRRIVGFESADPTKAVVTIGDKGKTLEHSQRDKNGETLWTDATPNAGPKASNDSFMDKVAKLRLTAYADEKEAASLKAVKPFLTIGFEKNGTALDQLVFKKTGGEKPGDKPTYWVTTGFLKTYGKLVPSRMEPIEKDAPALVSGEQKH